MPKIECSRCVLRFAGLQEHEDTMAQGESELYVGSSESSEKYGVSDIDKSIQECSLA